MSLLKLLFTLITISSSSFIYIFAQATQSKPLKIEGVVSVSDQIWMKSTEVSIQEWVEFIVNQQFDPVLFPNPNKLSKTTSHIFNDLSKNKQQKYFDLKERYITNSTKFIQVVSSEDKIINVFPSSALKALIKKDTTGFSLMNPITGITFEQALRFCEWKEKIFNTDRKVEEELQITLPSIEIYKQVIMNRDSLNKEKCALFNWVSCGCENKKKNGIPFQGKSLLPVDSYWPSKIGLYNEQGNAAEMTSTRGIAMGGSFRHSARESFRDQVQEYNQPEDWLGFRFVVTMKYK